MQNEKEQARGTARVWLDEITVNDFDTERAIVDGLTAAGYDVEVMPEFVKDPPFPRKKCGSKITVFRVVTE